ncbi:HAD-IA family hydrolase [Nocardia ninae]|uniref:Sugar phosphatase n=1 Tax=Nocardia ninae NBRC 108245 TaxID=1210091 RepID=A0A511MPB6_9NOCA|nr:sugar phosphatase [Nocardia ninae NBRC 108245]
MPTDVACTAVLFDCDGVLVDSIDSGARAWTRWAREYGLDPAVVLPGIHGRRSMETVRLFLPEDARVAGLGRIEDIEISEATDTEALPGARELLEAMTSDSAIVTSASAALLAARLGAAGLPLPSIAITAADVQAGKPAPDGYLLAAQQLGRPIEHCVIFEDSVTGVAAGLAAGPHCVVGVGERALDTPADIVVRDLSGTSRTEHGLRFAEASILRSPGRDLGQCTVVL